MALKNRNRAIVKNVEFKQNESVIIPIPQDNLIRRISLHGQLNTKTGAVAGVGIKNGALLNLVKRIQVRLNGSDNIFDVDLRSYFTALHFEYGAKPFVNTYSVPIANESNKLFFEIPIDFALIRNQISDYSAVLPAQLLDSVELIVTWGSISDLLTTPNNTTIDDTTKIKVSIIEVYSNSADNKEIDAVISKAVKVYEGVEQTSITRDYLSYPADELPVQVRPVPARHLTAVVFGLSNITDGNPAYSNDVISQIKLENVKGGGEAIFYDFFGDLNRGQQLDFKLELGNLNLEGVVIFDWIDLRNGSLDNIDVDALKWKFLTGKPAANKENALRIYKKYIVVSQT